MEVSSGNSWDEAFSLSPRERPIIPNGPPTMARAATPSPILAKKLRRVWPDCCSGSISLAKVFS